MIAIEIKGKRIEIHEGAWSGPRKIVNIIRKTEPFLRLISGKIYDPDRDMTSAKLVADFFKGKIVDASRHEPVHYGKQYVY